MEYKFIGKPDKIFPKLKNGKIYNLTIQSDINVGFKGVFSRYPIVIVEPFLCPYTSQDAFNNNWKRL